MFKSYLRRKVIEVIEPEIRDCVSFMLHATARELREELQQQMQFEQDELSAREHVEQFEEDLIASACEHIGKTLH